MHGVATLALSLELPHLAVVSPWPQPCDAGLGRAKAVCEGREGTWALEESRVEGGRSGARAGRAAVRRGGQEVRGRRGPGAGCRRVAQDWTESKQNRAMKEGFSRPLCSVLGVAEMDQGLLDRVRGNDPTLTTLR